jgi:hypothetical protein
MVENHRLGILLLALITVYRYAQIASGMLSPQELKMGRIFVHIVERR